MAVEASCMLMLDHAAIGTVHVANVEAPKSTNAKAVYMWKNQPSLSLYFS